MKNLHPYIYIALFFFGLIGITGCSDTIDPVPGITTPTEPEGTEWLRLKSSDGQVFEVFPSTATDPLTKAQEDWHNLSIYDYLKHNLGMLFLVLGGVYIVSSFGEEVIYRAFLINRISRFGAWSKHGTAIAVILSSVVFGLAHYEWGPMGMVQTGFMGLALGICYIKLKKRLWILILAHAYMDTILMVQMYLASN